METDVGTGAPSVACGGDRLWQAPEVVRLSQLLRRVASGPTASPTAIQARSVWSLAVATGQPALDRALESLEGLAEERPDDPELLNDLGVAYLVRGEAAGEPLDLLRALEKFEEARGAAPGLTEAAFNRALTLELLYASSSAAAAWQEYARSEEHPDWLREARQRALVVARTSRPKEVGPPSRLSEPAEYRSFGELHPQEAREYALEVLLPDWGARYLTGHASVSSALELAAALAAGIESAGGDATLSALLASLSEMDPEDRRSTADGLAAYGRGRRLEATDPTGAFDELERAVALLENLAPVARDWAAIRLGFLVMTRDEVPDVEQARQLHQGVIADADSVRFPALVGRAQWGVALNAGRAGFLIDALRAQQLASEHFAAAGDRRNLARSDALISELHRLLGDYASAARAIRKSLSELTAVSDARFVPTRFLNLGDIAWKLNLPSAALAMHTEAVERARRTRDSGLVSQNLLWRAKLHVRLGDDLEAAADLEQARRLHGPEDSLLAEHARLATARLQAQRDPGAAARSATVALDYFWSRDLALNAAEALQVRAESHLRGGSNERARADLLRGLELLLRRGQAEARASSRVGVAELVRELVDGLVKLELARGRPADALRATEIARLASLASNAEIDRLTQLLAGGRLPLASWPEDPLVAWWLLDDRVVAWAVREGRVDVATHPLSRSRVLQEARRFVGEIRRGSEKGDAGRRLAAALFGEWPESVAKARHPVVIVPDPDLLGIPIAALPFGPSSLVEALRYEIAPSVGGLVRRPDAPTGPLESVLVAAFGGAASGLPPLRQVESEAAEIRAVYASRGEVAFAAPASKSAFVAALQQFDVLHYAGHAVSVPGDPWASHLVVGGDDGSELLYARELEQLLRGSPRLVVLSACSSIIEADAVGNGFVGLARPFLTNGSESVVGTLWPIDDAVARASFTEFHRDFVRSGSVSEALRTVQLQMIRDPQTDRSDWAGLYAIGTVRQPGGTDGR